MPTGIRTARARAADLVRFPGAASARDGVQHAVDCNSPSFWEGDSYVLFNSYAQPWRISSPDLFHLGPSEPVTLRGEVDGKPLRDLFIWIESIVRRPGGPLYGFFHYEPDGVCKPGAHLPTAPRVLAMRSLDLGRSWDLQGVVLEAPPDSLHCGTRSPWDAGGQGDFSVIVDRDDRWAYLFYSSYVRQPEEQGIAVARIATGDLEDPVGKVRKWYRGSWSEPGLGGGCTPVFPSKIDWHRDDADIFWGPSIHWNTFLESYVMLMSRAVDTRMTGDGTWITFPEDLAAPARWREPIQLLRRDEVTGLTEGGRACNATTHGWYPQVVGTTKGESDTLCGRTGRLFIAGISRAEIEFLRGG
jgi:hypothetical protein